MTPFVLLAACRILAGLPDADDPDSGASVRRQAESTAHVGDDPAIDSATPDTGSAEDSDASDSGGGDTGACDAGRWLSIDTGLDTGTGPAIAQRSDAGALDERYVDETVDNCDVSTLSASADPLLACMGTGLDLTAARYRYGTSAYDWQFEWAGDLDDDGFDDVLLIGTEAASRLVPLDYFFYGAPNLGTRDSGNDPLALAEASAESVDERAMGGFADLDADGDRDVLVDMHGFDVDPGEVGLVPGDGIRKAGAVSTIGAGTYWADYGEAAWSGYPLSKFGELTPRRVWVADVTGDGIDDLLLDGRRRVTEVASVLPGRAGLVPGGPIDDALSFVATQSEDCFYADSDGYKSTVCWSGHSTPLGDIDGDGMEEVGIVLGPWAEAKPYYGASGSRWIITTPGSFPACSYDVHDVASLELTSGDSSEFAWNRGMTVDRLVDAFVPVQDLDGDGNNDVVVVDHSVSDYRHQLMHTLYSGERALRFGGDLATTSDRIEFPSAASDVADWVWAPTFAQAADLEGDGIDELLFGGSYEYDDIGSDTAWYGRAHLDVVAGSLGGLRGVRRIEDVISLSLSSPVDGLLAVPGRGRGDFDGDGSDDLLAVWRSRLWSTAPDGSRDEPYDMPEAGFISGADVASEME